MKLHRRYLGYVSVAENAVRTLQMPLNYVYSAIQLELVVQMNRTAGSAGTCRDSAPAQLVKRIELVLNGKNTIRRIDMETLHRWNQIYHNERPFIYAANLLGFAELTNDVSKIMAQLDFELPHLRQWYQGIDCLLDARGLSSLDLVITFGAAVDTMNDAQDGVMSLGEGKLFIYILERVGAPTINYGMWKQFHVLQHTLAGAGIVTLDFPVNTTYEQLLIRTHSDNNQVDTIIPFGLANQNAIDLYSGSEHFMTLPAGLLQSVNRLENQIAVPERIGSAAALNHAQQELLLEGYYQIPFIHDGRLTEMLDTTRLSDLKVNIDAAVPGTQNVIETYASEIILPKQPTAAAVA